MNNNVKLATVISIILTTGTALADSVDVVVNDTSVSGATATGIGYGGTANGGNASTGPISINNPVNASTGPVSATTGPSNAISNTGASTSALNFSPKTISNYQAQKYRTQFGPGLPTLVQSSANKFISNGSSMSQNAQLTSGFLQEQCDQDLITGTEPVETYADWETDNTTGQFAPFFDTLNGVAKGDSNAQTVRLTYNLFKEFAGKSSDIKHYCIGVITMKSTEKDVVTTQTLKLEAVNYAKNLFHGVGKLTLVAESSTLTSFEGVDSDGLSWGLGLNSAGNAGAPLIGASASVSGNTTSVDPGYQTGQTFYILAEVPDGAPGGHYIVDAVKHNLEDQKLAQEAQLQAQANAIELAKLQANNGGNGAKAVGAGGH